MIRYLIEEEWHSSIEWEYNTYGEAINELKRRANLPWDKEPNLAPCTSWRTCSKLYVIRTYDNDILLSEEEILEISSKWVDWKINL